MITDVVVVGGGPNGLMLACELALAGLRPVVLESLPAPSGELKANGLLGQVVRMVDHRGLYERISGNPGSPQPNSTYFMFGAMTMNLSLLADSPIYTLPAPQAHIVRVLEMRAVELGVEIRRGHEVVGLEQDDDTVAVDVVADDGAYQLVGRYVVGADGAHSVTRKRSGIAFPGVTYDRTTTRTAHVVLSPDWADPATGGLNVPGYGPVLPFLPQRTERGGFTFAPFPGQPAMIATTEWDQPKTDAPMSLDELRASIRRVLGVEMSLDAPSGDGPSLLRRLTGSNTRVADRFRNGRVFLIGDAAHVYSTGGSGLNLGLQDAVNLGWKLAAEIRGHAPTGLLDSYDTERRQAARRVIVNTEAQLALIAPGSEVTGLRELFTELLGDRDTVQRLADLTAGTDIRYEMGECETHPMVGRFAPELEVQTDTGTVRLAELTRTGRPLLLDLTEDGSVAEAMAQWRDRVDVVTARSGRSGPTALLLRPDCYVAWASESSQPTDAELDSLRSIAARWFGAPIPART